MTKKKRYAKSILQNEKKILGKSTYRSKVYSIVLIIFSFILYGNTIPNNYSLDDNLVIYGDANVKKGIPGIVKIFSSPYREVANNTYGYRPIAKTTFAIEKSIFGFNPHVSHFFNVILYALALIILFRVLRKIFEQYNPLFIFFAVLLFAAHPIHTEVVASLKNREELLSFVFGILALDCFINYVKSKKVKLILWGTAAFVLAVLSKQTALSFIFIIPLTVFFLTETKADENQKRENTDISLFKSPYIMLSMLLWAFGIFTFYFFSYFSVLVLAVYYLAHHVKGNRFKPGFYHVIGMALFAISFAVRRFEIGNFNLYSRLFLAAAFIFPFLLFIVSKVQRRVVAIGLICIILGVIGYAINVLPEKIIFSSDKTLYYFENPLFAMHSLQAKISLTVASFGKYFQLLVYPHPLGFYYGFNTVPVDSLFTVKNILTIILHLCMFVVAVLLLKRRHIISYLILFYFSSLILFSNFIMPVPGIIAERLSFIASVAFCVALAYTLFKVFKIDYVQHVAKQNKIKYLMVLLAILVPYSAITIIRNMDWKSNLSLYKADMDNLNNSAKANALYADELMRLTYNAASEKKELKGFSDTISLAINHYKQALEIYPDYPSVNNNLGTIYFNFYKEYSRALDYFKKAYVNDTENTESIYNVAMTYEALDKVDSSLAYYIKYCRVDSANVEILSKTAVLCFKQGQYHQAVSLNDKIKSLNPASDFPYINLGNYLLSKGDTIAAVSQWEQAIAVYPDNYNLCMNLYLYYTSINNLQKAEIYLQKAKNCTPNT